jgi:hypothetical protein
MTATLTDKQALLLWEDFCQGIKNDVPKRNETPEQKHERMKRQALPGNQEEWFVEYFPKAASAKPAQFHIDSTLSFLKAPRLFQCRAWARGLAKSTRRMMEVFYKMFVQKVRINCLLVSKSVENAERLLAPYRAHLQANPRLIADYGIQETAGKWTASEFFTRSGSAFRAVGKGQNPRGSKNDEMRVNLIIFDDVDDDEECRNIDRLNVTWEWIQQAVIPTVDISSPYWIAVDNNIIAEDSIAVRARTRATHKEIVNIRTNGVSTWKEKNSEDDVDFMLGLLDYASGQKEYFNNPMSNGNTFPEMKYGKCPPLHTLPYVVMYADPGTSNQDKPSGKSKAHNSSKGIVLVGFDGVDYYIYKCFLDNMNQSQFVEGYYTLWKYATRKKAKATFNYIENNALQNPFWEQVLKGMFREYGKRFGAMLLLTPDTRAKPDKWTRIQAMLEPLNRQGHLILNVEEKDDPHMQRLETQFKSGKATSKTLDGPDMVEGAVFKIREKQNIKRAGGAQVVKRKRSNKHA